MQLHDIHKIPPQSSDAEMSILGGILIDNDAINRVLEVLTPEDFYRESHRKIFQAMMKLSDLREPCDLITMTDMLKKAGELEEVGGAAYLANLVDYVPTAANISYYCKIVKEKAFYRRLITVGTEIAMLGYSEADCASDLVEAAFAKIAIQMKMEPIGAAALVIDAARRLKTRYANRGKIQGIPYGYPALDSMTCGMHRGELIVMAGRPSMGKSALGCNILENICEAGYFGMLFSLEMDAGNVIDRMIASRGGISYGNIRSGNLTQMEWSRNAKCSDAISKYRLAIDDTPAINLRELKAKARKQKKAGLDVVVVDYLQLISVTSKESRALAIGELSRGLKQMARELDCTVVLLSQLNRNVDTRPDKRPNMSDLRDSGEIEQDADVILFPYRPAAYCPKCKDKVNDGTHHPAEHQAVAEIIIEKQRNGERNISIPMVWMGAYQRFEGVSPVCRGVEA